MALINKLKRACRILCIALVLLFILLSGKSVSPRDVQQQLTRDEFTSELMKAVVADNQELSESLIKDHRLLVKPFVNALIAECIIMELKGKNAESKQVLSIAERTADIFETIFGEKSLSIGVSYMIIWSKEQKRLKLVADSLYGLGLRLRDSEPEKAIECYLQALNTFRKITDERGEAEVLGGLGQIYWDKDNQASLSYYKEALDKREKVDDRQLIGNTLNSLGLLYSTFSKDYQQAISYFDRAVLIRTEIADQVNLNRTLSNKAEAHLKAGNELNSAGNYPEALEKLEKALLINRNLYSKVRTGVVLNQMGYVYANMGDLPGSLEKLNEAADIMKEENDMWELAGVYNHFGIVLQNAGRTEKSLEYYNNALALYEKQEEVNEILPILSNIGTIYFKLNDYARAEEYHIKALQISRQTEVKDDEVRCLLNLANDQNLLGKLDDAKANYSNALDIATTLNNPDLIWRIIAGMGEYYEQKGDIGKAVQLNDSALLMLDGIRNTLRSEEWKTSFMAQERFVFEDVIDLLANLHIKDPNKDYDVLAFQYAERSKARAFLDLLAGSLANTESGDDQRSDVFKYSLPVSLQETKDLCPDKNTVFLEYFVGDSSSCLWVITKKDHQLFLVPGRKILQEQIETIRFALLDPELSNREFFTRTASSLYEQLIKPAEPYLSPKSRLVIIPDGVLNYLPFEVLLTGTKGIKQEIPYYDMPFLVKKFPISYVQSASVLRSLLSEQTGSRESGSGNKKLIAFGDPVYGGEKDTAYEITKSYERLQYSGKEVENIASFFRNGDAEIYIRSDATEENVKKEREFNRFDYLHFATHGFIDEIKPDFSSLVLTHDVNSEEDGYLRASEIFNLKLNSELVVLSACQTGLGKLIRGEGMVGLTRAFMYAGAPSILVSLWSVSDISTATLMGEFYKYLIKNKLYKTDALRKAQLSLITNPNYSHPFYWAPFVLIGDWR